MSNRYWLVVSVLVVVSHPPTEVRPGLRPGIADDARAICRLEVTQPQPSQQVKTMKRTFEVLNVKCGGCASALKTALRDEFGEVEVDLDVTPRIITLDIDDGQIDHLRSQLVSLGYPMSDEELKTIEKIGTTAKSFVSCAIGRMDKGEG